MIFWEIINWAVVVQFMMDNSKTFIYALVDPRDLLIKYIGKADDPYDRLYKHMTPFALKTKTRKNSWLKSLKDKKLKPIVEIIDTIDNTEWGFWERHYISLYKSWGFNLTNDPHCEGGEAGPRKFGSDNHMTKPEFRKMRSEAMSGDKNPSYGKASSDNQKAAARLRKGKTYEEIYGVEGAKLERAKRFENRSRK